MNSLSKKNVAAIIAAITMVAGITITSETYTGYAMTVGSELSAEELIDKNSGLHYFKADENNDGIYDHVVITAEYFHPSAGYIEYPYNENYEITGNGYGYNTNYAGLTSIVVPDKIDGLPVTEIDSGAFARCNDLESITLPQGITKITGMTFYGSRKLKNVTMPDTVTDIESAAFYDCVNIEKIIIPDGVKAIGRAAFSRCRSLKSIELPKSVEVIEEGAFGFCDSLTDITIKNEKCLIHQSPETISAEDKENYFVDFNGTIHGYSNSTAQKYANRWEYKFEALIDSDSVTDTTKTLTNTTELSNGELGKVSAMIQNFITENNLSADTYIDSDTPEEVTVNVYDWQKEKETVEPIKEFMKENNIDESCVVFMIFEGQEPILGDANGDGTLNIRDCAEIAKFAAQGKADSLPDTADYNKDGKKNVRDGAAIAKELAKVK